MISGTSGDSDERPAILIVDDQPANLLALEAVLEPLGYELVGAQSGEEALEKSLRRDFVLIVMDVHMPTLDGYATVELLRARPRSREVPIVFLTAIYGLQAAAHRGYALGAADFITKPFDPVALRAKVSALVGLYTRGRREERARREEMDRLKNLVVGALGHDLRNPLYTIMMAARALRSVEEVGPAAARRVDVIERAARRMNRMLEDVADLTSSRFSGSIPLKRRAADLSAICSEVVSEFRSAYPERRIDFDVSGDVTGDWDESRLGRVLGNLLRNAVHHGADTAVAVRLAADGANVKLAVHNGGPPIAPALMPELFEPFRRGSAEVEGLGLGLHIVREIARAHGGDVEVRSSEAEKGTTFLVTLPRRPSEPSL